jgi:hypothetical protein
MARKCSEHGCAFSLPDKYPLDKCPWHLAPGKGPVKIAAAITIAAAGLGGGLAYKKFRAYLRDKEARKKRRKKTASMSQEQQAASKSKRQPRARKKTATKRAKPKAVKTETT